MQIVALNSVTVVIIPNGPVNSEVNLSMYREDGRVTAETYVGWIEQKYEIKSEFVGWKTENSFQLFVCLSQHTIMTFLQINNRMILIMDT
jgi:hypothetical protein